MLSVRSIPAMDIEVAPVFVDKATWTVKVYEVLEPSSAVTVMVTGLVPVERFVLPVTTTAALASVAIASTVTEDT